jgi:hypothetical protein
MTSDRAAHRGVVGVRARLSVLHAAPAFFPVYRGAGYVGTRTSWTVVPFRDDPSALVATTEEEDDVDDDAKRYSVRPVRFPLDTDQLSQHYDRLYSSRSGCMVRSAEYWEKYLGEEWKGSFWVATTATEAQGREDIRGWMIARWRGTSDNGTSRVQICDFGYDSSGGPGRARDVFSVLVQNAVHELCRADGLSVSLVDLVLPTVVADVISASPDGGVRYDGIDWANATEECDLGWMYKALDERGQEFLDQLVTASHLMWPADSF